MRYVFSIGAGSAVAIALFLLMQWLITSEDLPLKREGMGKMVDFIRVKQQEYTQFRERTPPEKPEPPMEPPPPPSLATSDSAKPQGYIMSSKAKVGGGPKVGAWNDKLQAREGDVIPIFRIEPRYPRDALLSGIEGWVKLEITINEDGSVSAPVVLDSNPPRVFDQEAKRAVLKWKFKPRIVDGKAVKRQATQTIEFKLALE